MREDERADILIHLEELRNRILRGLLYIGLGAVAGWYLYQPVLFPLLTNPVRLPLARIGGKMIFLGLMEPFMIRFQVALIAGFILASPLVFYELWAFVAPGLTQRERQSVRPLLPAAVGLFFAGVAFGFWLMPVFISWMLSFTPKGVDLRPSLNATIVLLAKIYLAFGLSFELPVVVIFLARVGILNSETMIRRWREAIFIIFVIAAIVTPTWDMFTMTICALPMVALYLGSIGVVWRMERRRRRQEDRAPTP